MEIQAVPGREKASPAERNACSGNWFQPAMAFQDEAAAGPPGSPAKNCSSQWI
jgi:hypothetical protein